MRQHTTTGTRYTGTYSSSTLSASLAASPSLKFGNISLPYEPARTFRVAGAVTVIFFRQVFPPKSNMGRTPVWEPEGDKTTNKLGHNKPTVVVKDVG